MGFFDKTVNNKTDVDNTFNDYYTPVGVDGQGNRTIGSYGTDRSVQVGGPIADTFGDDAFAPQFNFNVNRSGGGNTSGAALADYVDPGYMAEFQRHKAYAGASDQRSFEQWLRDYANESQDAALWNDTAVAGFLQGGQFQAPAPVAPPASITTGPENFAGAVQGAGFNVAGNISAPVSSGEDSFSAQLGVGVIAQGDIIDSPTFNAPISAPVILGDNINSPIISAPISAPAVIVGGDLEAPVINSTVAAGGISAPIAAGGDVDIAGPVITGVQGNVQIMTSDPEVARAAIAAAGGALESSLAFANKALAAVGESRRDPGEKVTSDALNTVLWAALGFGALTIFS